jgi:SAM-dependent methyltransferase
MAVDDLLVCSVCHGSLRDTDNDADVECLGCARSYARRDGIADLTPAPPPDEVLRSKWSLWEELQANGEMSYQHESEASLSVGERQDAARFTVFCNLRGTVLDVGCGPQARPSYAGAERFVGIDPLRGERRREFDFVQGIGEYLPFCDGVFDHVLFATSLDHLLDPTRALREAARVLAPHGTIEIWSGEVPEPPTLVQSVATAVRLLGRAEVREFAQSVRDRLHLSRRLDSGYVVPSGAADAFHFFQPTRAKVDGIIAAADLVPLEVVSPEQGQRFVRVAPQGR